MNVEIARLIAENEGHLPSYSSVGLYPLYYLTKDNKVLCPDCANAVIRGIADPFLNVKPSDIVDCRVNWNDVDLHDEEGHKIESATLYV